MAQNAIASYNQSPSTAIAVSLVESFKLSAMVTGFTRADTFVRSFAGTLSASGANTLASRTGYQSVRSKGCTYKSGLSSDQTKVREYISDGRASNHASEVSYHIRTLKMMNHTMDGTTTVLSGDEENPFIVHPMSLRLVLPMPPHSGIMPQKAVMTDDRVCEAFDTPLEDDHRRFKNAFLVLEEEEAAAPEPAFGCGMMATQCVTTCADSCASMTSTCTAAARAAYLAAVGFNDITVVDVQYDAVLFTKIHEAVVGSLLATGERKAPAYYNGKGVSVINQHMRIIIEKAVDHSKFTSEHREYMINVGRAIVLALIMNLGNQLGAVLTVTRHNLNAPCPDEFLKAIESDSILASSHELAAVFPHIDHETIVPVIPAIEMTGNSYEEVEVRYDEDAIRLFVEKADGERDTAVGALVTGCNLFGAAPPNDCRHPISFVSGLSRHVMGTEVDLPTSSVGDVFKAKIDKSKGKRPSPVYYRVARDIAIGMRKKLKMYLADEGWATDEAKAYVPGKMTEDKSAEVLTEWWAQAGGVSQENSLSQAIVVGVFLKAAEQNPRARFISQPGANGSQEIHQACAVRGVKTVEKFLKIVNNHTHFKGLTVPGVCKDVGEFLDGLGTTDFVFSFDKKSNDRTWSAYHYEAYVEFMLGMLSEFMLMDGTDQDTSELKFWNHQSDGFDLEGRTAYFSYMCSAIYYYLLSAVGPTSSANRWQSSTEIGVITYMIHGEAAYNNWLTAYLHGAPSDHEWDGDWNAHGDEYFVKLKWDTTIPTPVKFKNEGDDQIQAHRPTKQCDTWDKMLKRIVEVADKHLRILLEVVIFDEPGKVCVGPNALLEVCSRGFGNRKGDYTPRTAMMVPKPVKNCSKMAWMHSNSFKFCRNQQGLVAGVQDDEYWRLSATRALAIAEYNCDSPFVGPFVLAHAMRAVSKLPGNATARFEARSMEARHVEDADLAHRMNANLRSWLEELQHKSDSSGVATDPALSYLAAHMWKLENKSLALTPTKVLCGQLVELDYAMRQHETLPEEWVHDPVCAANEMDLTFLHPLIESKYAKLANHIKEIGQFSPEKITHDRLLARMKKAAPDTGKKEKIDEPISTRGLRDVLMMKKTVAGSEPAETEAFYQYLIDKEFIEPVKTSPNAWAAAQPSADEIGENGMSPATHSKHGARPCAFKGPRDAKHSASAAKQHPKNRKGGSQGSR